MTQPNLPPNIHLAVAVVVYDGKFLVTWNSSWGTFSLPITKIRQWHLGNGHLDPTSETALQAAVRAAAEGLERPLLQSEIPSDATELELQPYSHRSFRDGQWKRYGREVFVFEVKSAEPLQRCVPGSWISPSEITTLQPLSPTVDEVVSALTATGYNWSAK